MEGIPNTFGTINFIYLFIILKNIILNKEFFIRIHTFQRIWIDLIICDVFQHVEIAIFFPFFIRTYLCQSLKVRITSSCPKHFFLRMKSNISANHAFASGKLCSDFAIIGTYAHQPRPPSPTSQGREHFSVSKTRIYLCLKLVPSGFFFVSLAFVCFHFYFSFGLAKATTRAACKRLQACRAVFLLFCCCLRSQFCYHQDTNQYLQSVILYIKLAFSVRLY